MQNKNAETKSLTPPYLSVAKLEQVLELVSSRNFTDISSVQFTDRGFSTSDASYAVSTLKFLHLIDEKGAPMSQMASLRLQGPARTKEFEKIVRVAYKNLFDAMEAPQNLSSEDLANEFYAQYKDKVTPRIVRTAIPVFLKLCEFAGLKEKGTVISKKQSKHTKERVSSRVQTRLPGSKMDRSQLEVGSSQVLVAEGRIILTLPSQLKERLLDDENMEEDWRAVRVALKSFADKYIPKAAKPEESQEEGGVD